MAAPPKEGGTFTPHDIAQMTQACDLALHTILTEDGRFADGPHTELRKRLAGLVLAEATNAPIDADRLARLAVRSVRLISSGAWKTAR